jgi:hypothetical protein
MVATRGPCRGALIAFMAVALMAPGPGAGADDTPTGAASEYRIKAAYLYYFSTFVEWPDGSPSGGPLVIGVLGDDPFGDVLDETLRGKTAGGRPLVARRFESVREARVSHILFISSSERDHLASILKALDGATVLTVGDIDEFASLGGQFGFRTEDKKVRFDINVTAVDRARLKVSAQLLKLGRIVGTAKQREG